MRVNGRWFLVLSLAIFSLPAEVVRVEVTERGDVLGGKSFGSAGPYTFVSGKVHFAVDPKLPVNRAVTDLDHAPRNAQGRVEFAADVFLLQPKDPARGNGAAFYEVANRGRKGLLSTFNLGSGTNNPRAAADFGDGFLLERGFTVVWLGWQWDVPAEPHLLRFYAPIARDGAKPLTGLVRADFVPDERVPQIYVGDRTHTAYPVINPDDPSLHLTVRDRRDGPRRTIPRRDWTLDAARTHLSLPAGFEPGKIYELVYQSQDPAVAGLGPAAIRDFISYLKRNPAQYGVRRALAYGSSQSGRFLRTFLYAGFNEDEQGARVFDGVWAHIGGAGRGSFNHRFAQPSRDARPYFNFFYPTDIFPFSDESQTDPITGLTDGLLARAMKGGVVPRIFYTNGAYEYYGRGASLIHTTVDGQRDFAPADNTRIYFVAGSQHGPAAAFPPRREGTQNLASSNDYRWAMRALLVALDRWVAGGTPPPPSLYPQIARDQLVRLSGVNFPKLPGVNFPTRLHDVFELDYGPRFRSQGVVTVEPPKRGRQYPVLLPQVDRDGNETSGLRMPWVQIPLATYTGWNLRDAKIGAPEEMYSFGGSTLPFARTRAERERSGDPRPSIEERYRSREDYLDKVRAVVRDLAAGGYLLDADSAAVVKQAAAHWDHWTQAVR